jgi:crotonobetainyl-CoA:carnitine CoA-transferase CaiB-like acyl-CoA transferase
MASALDGLTVIDLTTHLSGPYCAMILADHGADVIKVERPEGDDTRRVPPFISGESAPFMLWNRNKSGVVLDLKQPDDRAALLALIDGADVVLENFRPGTMDRLGLGWDSLRARNPRLVYGAISGFGQTGPYAKRGGFDLVAQAMSGLMAMNGPKDGPPHRLPIAISDVTAGMFLAIGVLMALEARHRTGQGQRVETSLLEAAMSMQVYEAAQYLATGARPERLGQAHRGSSPYQMFATADGHIVVGGAGQAMFLRLCAIIECPDWPDDPRFATNAARVAHNDELVALIEARLGTRPSAWWLARLEEAGIPAGPVMTHDQVFTDPQVLARGMVAEVEHAKAGRVRTLGVPIKLDATPGAVRRPAPALDEHGEAIRARARSKVDH